MVRVLFVCMGNICRSPTAEGVFRMVVSRTTPEIDIEIDSAGTHDYHIGQAPDQRAQMAALRRGIDLSQQRARLVTRRDFERFDLILAMDEHNLNFLRSLAPTDARARLRLVMDYAPAAHAREVPDPYYGGATGFEEVLDLLEQAAEGLLEDLAGGRTRAGTRG